MSKSVKEKRAAFREMHRSGCFVLPNPWDVGSARMLEQLGFSALASTSAGFAWTLGKPDNGVTRDQVLQHLTELSAAVDIPVNADFESGFAEDVTENIRRVDETGVAGFSIEDRVVGEPSKLYSLPEAEKRIAAARRDIDQRDSDVLLVARTELLLLDPRDVTKAIDKLVAFAAAGADCLFAPGVYEPADITAMVRAVAPKPLNVVVFRPGLTVKALEDLGVRRVSVGGGLARVAWTALKSAADQMKAGSFEALASAAPSGQITAFFSR